jgi:acetylornithine/N-succinyldiaminopimelate aminotransferase
MNLFDVYPLFDIEPVSATGSWITDKKGDKYLDLYGGHAVISVGHSHPYYIEKISNQLNRIGFYSNSVKISLQEELAEKLGKLSGYEDYALFLCNSGAEANENAFKLASFHNGRKQVVAFKGSFHGRTSAAVAATDDPSINAPVNENDHFLFASFNDTKSVEELITENTCAVIIEGIQGVGGIQVPDLDFLKKIREICTKTGALLILDEVQSGYGRSGKFFAHQYAGIQPDIITVAKGMGNGFPIAGVLIHPGIKPKYSMLGTTFGGNHLACAAGIAVLDIIEKEKLLQNANEKGQYLIEKLSGIEGVKDLRGRGLMIGIELENNGEEIRKQLLSGYRIFTGTSSNKNTIRILPALNIKKEELDIFINAFTEVLDKTLAV